MLWTPIACATTYRSTCKQSFVFVFVFVLSSTFFLSFLSSPLPLPLSVSCPHTEQHPNGQPSQCLRTSVVIIAIIRHNDLKQNNSTDNPRQPGEAWPVGSRPLCLLPHSPPRADLLCLPQSFCLMSFCVFSLLPLLSPPYPLLVFCSVCYASHYLVCSSLCLPLIRATFAPSCPGCPRHPPHYYPNFSLLPLGFASCRGHLLSPFLLSILVNLTLIPCSPSREEEQRSRQNGKSNNTEIAKRKQPIPSGAYTGPCPFPSNFPISPSL